MKRNINNIAKLLVYRIFQSAIPAAIVVAIGVGIKYDIRTRDGEEFFINWYGWTNSIIAVVLTTVLMVLAKKTKRTGIEELDTIHTINPSIKNASLVSIIVGCIAGIVGYIFLDAYHYDLKAYEWFAIGGILAISGIMGLTTGMKSAIPYSVCAVGTYVFFTGTDLLVFGIAFIACMLSMIVGLILHQLFVVGYTPENGNVAH